MSFALLGGWSIQAAAVVILLAKVGRLWTRHLGAIFILLAVTYHGLGEILYRLTPAQNEYRRYVEPGAQESFFVAISVAILILTVAYVGVLREPKRRYPLDVEELRYYFDWRIMVALTAPLAIWALTGASAAAGDINNPARLSAPVGLSLQFTLIALTLTGVSLVLRFGPKALGPLVVADALVMSFIGQRGGVVIAVIMLIYVASQVDVRLTRRWLIGIFVFGTLAVLVMTSSRSAVGREAFGAGMGTTSRFDALVAGAENIGNGSTWEGVQFDVSYRLDGNAFPSLQMERINEGFPGMGLVSFKNNVLAAMPSAVYPEKLNLPLEVRSEKRLAQMRLGLPYRDSLYTQMGGTVGYFGRPGLFLFAGLMGVGLAILDRALLAGPTPKRLVIGVGALNAVAHYSASLDYWFISARGVLLLLLGIWALQMVRRRATTWQSRSFRTYSM